MMKMMMRPQKTQLPTGNIVFNNSGTFDRTKYSMFGYSDYKAILVGGAGGRSGRANGRTVSGKTSWVDSSGGGGGGFLVFKGKLSDIAAQSAVTVGSRGGDGSDSSNNVQASNGSDGGTTSFAGRSATGGKGGKGGKYNITTGGNATITLGRGGNGGSNSSDLGAVGIGGTTATAEGDLGGLIGEAPSQPPSEGQAGTGTGNLIAGGGGGGGGEGRVRLFDDYKGAASDGASGATGIGNYDALGSVAENDSGAAGAARGGFGGGCDAGDFLGFVGAYYGTAGITRPDTVRTGTGVVIIQVS
jgi:hypothetical protein